MLSLYESKLLSGEVYTAARGVTIASGASASVRIENPSDSGKTLVVQNQEVVTDADSSGTYYRGASVTGATDASAENDLVGDASESVASVTHDGTYADASSTVTFPFTGGSGPASTILNKRPPIALQEGESIAVEVDANAECGALFLFTFYETERQS